MTLERLRPILKHQNTPSAVLTVLGVLGGMWTAVQLIEATGKARSRLYEALETLTTCPNAPVTKAGQTYVLKAGLVPETGQNQVGEESRKRDKVESDPLTFVPEAGQPSSPESGTVPEAGQAEKADSDTENTESPGSGTTENLPLLLSTSFKEKDSLKTKKQKKKKEGESEGESYEPRTDPRIPDWVPPELWTDFCDHRQNIKNPLTKLAVSYIVGDLERWLPEFGLEASLESLRRTIRSGKWIDIYKPKPPEKSRASPAPRPRFRMTMTEEDAHD